MKKSVLKKHKRRRASGWRSAFAEKGWVPPPPEEKGYPPSLSPKTSVCQRRAFMRKTDANGGPACWTCGLYHGETQS